MRVRLFYREEREKRQMLLGSEADRLGVYPEEQRLTHASQEAVCAHKPVSWLSWDNVTRGLTNRQICLKAVMERNCLFVMVS